MSLNKESSEPPNSCAAAGSKAWGRGPLKEVRCCKIQLRRPRLKDPGNGPQIEPAPSLPQGSLTQSTERWLKLLRLRRPATWVDVPPPQPPWPSYGPPAGSISRPHSKPLPRQTTQCGSALATLKQPPSVCNFKVLSLAELLMQSDNNKCLAAVPFQLP